MRAHSGASFLASATPAAGKTTFGLHIAHRMLSANFVSRVVVAGPTTHICRQWAADAARYGIDLEPNRPNSDGPESADFHGVAVTYQTIAAGPDMHRGAAARRPTLLIADEPHHMGDLAAWGVRTRRAFDSARFRLLLSGTPFRSDNSAIPWVTYDEDGISRADYAYGYPQALRDRVCRPITFLPYDGEMEWLSDGRLRSADFDLAPAGGGVGPAPADGAQPGGRVDGPRAARRRRPAERGARRRTPRRGRPGHRLRPGSRAGDRGAARRDLGRAAGAGDERRARRQPPHRRVCRLRPTLAGLGPDGLRGRRHPPPAGRRLRHGGPHRALLPPGRRPLHPHHPAARAAR